MEQSADKPIIIGEDRQYVPVLIDDLKTDAYGETPLGYQRELNEAQVKRIIEEFRDVRRKEVIVSRRVGGPDAGKLFVVDGQHTLDALKRMHPPGTYLKVMLHHWTRDEERERFTEQRTNSRGVTVVHRFRVNLAYREPWEVEIAEVIKAAGAEISFTRDTGGNRLNAIAAVETIAKRRGKWMLYRVLCLLVENFPNERHNLEGRLLTGMADLLTMHPEISDRDIVRKIRGEKSKYKSPAALVDGGVSAPVVTQRLIEVWNVGRQDGNKLTYDNVALKKNARIQLDAEAQEAAK